VDWIEDDHWRSVDEDPNLESNLQTRGRNTNSRNLDIPPWNTLAFLQQRVCHCSFETYWESVVSWYNLYPKTRGTIAKVKVQIELSKERHPHVWMGIDEKDLNMGTWQDIQYESVPNFCIYCKDQRHQIHVSTIKKGTRITKEAKSLRIKKEVKTKLMRKRIQGSIYKEQQGMSQH